jgi:ligand-binding sensor domain-containing protein
VRSVYTATVSAATADAVCGGTDVASVSVTYALIPSSNKLWIGSENSDSDSLGYASATLAATGTKDADVTATTAGSLPGAFDRDGNLWVIDNTGGEVGVKRYPAATLAAGGVETPDITLSSESLTDGVPGPSSIAFDSSGNLWVGVAYSGEVVEFAAAELSTSTDTAIPAVQLSAVPDPAAIAFDVKGNLWVGSGNNVLEYPAAALAASNNDAPVVTIHAQTPEPVVAPLSNVRGLAFNPAGQLWVNYDGTLALLTSLESGLVTPAIQVQTDVLALPDGIALDESGGLWLASSVGKFCKLSANQLLSSGSPEPELVITSSSLGSATSPAFFPAPAGVGLYSSLD